MNRLAYRAEWIWRQRGLSKLPFAGGTPPYAAERNIFVTFRKVVELADEPLSARVHVSADGRYQLFVNGQLVGRGPAPSTSVSQTADP